MDRTEPLIQFKGVDISNSDTVVISDLDFTVRKGDFVYITGRVGTGKTSIIRTLIAENRVSGEEARVLDFNLLKLKKKHIPYLRRKVGVVFQDFSLLMDRTVEENLRFALRCTGWKDRKQISQRISDVLDKVGLRSKAHKMPHQLSGGEQQRIAIARALLNAPELILADEPTGNLDAETADGIMQLLVEINRQGTAVVIVTHNLFILDRFPGRIFICQNNECHESDPYTLNS